MEFEEYVELGLNKNEAKAYESLVEFGKLSAWEVSSKGNVPYSRVYDVLDSLVVKGLVKVIPEKTKKFVPSDPEKFLELIEDKEKALRKAREKVKDLKKFYDVKEKSPVTMVFGKKGFYKIVKELKKDINHYNFSIKWSSEFRQDWAVHSRKRLRKGVDVRSLTRYDEETEKDVRKWLKYNKNMRKFDNEGFACTITDDEEVMISLIKSNVTLLIKDEAFAKVMKQMFLDSYSNAEKIKFIK